MKNATTIASEKTRSQANAKVDVTTEISKAGVYTIAFAAGIIGCLATLSLIAGAISSGGPLELVSNFFRAITG